MVHYPSVAPRAGAANRSLKTERWKMKGTTTWRDAVRRARLRGFLAKRIRARDGCLGIMRRRRTRQAAIGRGEPSEGFDPRISEWGNPPSSDGRRRGMNKDSPTGARRREVKHLSTSRKGKRSDCASSGERKRSSPNRGACPPGLRDPDVAGRRLGRPAGKRGRSG